MKRIRFMNMAFLGDRLVDTAQFLGVHPSLMATAHTPMIEVKMPVSRQIECTACVLGDKNRTFFRVAEKMGIKKILLEKNNHNTEIDPSRGEEFIRELGFEVDIIDFTRGIETAVLETCKALDLEKYAQIHITKYKKSFERASSLIPKNLDKRILVLLGMVQKDVKREFLLVEEAGGVNDYILGPSGCINVSGFIESAGDQKEKHDIRVINGLSGIIEAAPDMIALTCDPAPGLKALNRLVSEYPDAKNVPAIASHSVFSLPHCCQTEPMQRPSVLELWAEALSGLP